MKPEPTSNLLPYEGCVHYYGKLLNHHDALEKYELLLNEIEWKNDEAFIFGKHFITDRKVAWYADGDYSYTYSNKTKQANVWTETLLELKKMAELATGEVFNSCLLNLYHNGNEGMGWHSDDEKALGRNSAIASLSFGAERVFKFRHKKEKEIVSLLLEHGSLLVMKEETQANWQHCLAKSKRITEPRINLTFRQMVVL